jgi:hypothetical protein
MERGAAESRCLHRVPVIHGSTAWGGLHGAALRCARRAPVAAMQGKSAAAQLPLGAV